MSHNRTFTSSVAGLSNLNKGHSKALKFMVMTGREQLVLIKLCLMLNHICCTIIIMLCIRPSVRTLVGTVSPSAVWNTSYENDGAKTLAGVDHPQRHERGRGGSHPRRRAARTPCLCLQEF